LGVGVSAVGLPFFFFFFFFDIAECFIVFEGMN